MRVTRTIRVRQATTTPITRVIDMGSVGTADEGTALVTVTGYGYSMGTYE